MTRLFPNFAAAFAAIVIATISLNAVVTVPPLQAAVITVPELA